MKRQQLFNNFWLLTAVVLGIQPAWADTPPMSAVQFNPIISDVEVVLQAPDKASPRVTSSHSKVSTRPQQLSQKVVQPLESNGTSDNRNSQVTPFPTPTSPAIPSPVESDILNQGTPAPSYLNPSPNPLQFPTKPEEVRIQGTQPITLQQAFELARRNNRQLQVAELTLERSRAALREAQAALYPDLTINSDITRSQSAGGEIQAEQSAAQGFPSQEASPSTALSGTAQLSYDIYTAGERSGNIRANEEQVRFNQLDVERIASQLGLDVSNDYYNLQAGDELVRINRAAVINAEASLRDAQALEQAGVGTRFDVLRSQVQLANATQDLTQALGDQLTARRQLARRLSLAQSIGISAADPVEIAGLWNLSLEESIVLAFQNRAELEQQLAQRNISESQRRIALAQIRPRISLITSYNVLDDFDDNVSGVADGFSLGARFSLNLYDGGAARARASQEESNIAIAETNFADARDQVRFEVEQAYADLLSNLENIQTASVALEQAREALRLARLRFQAGVGTQTDVINAENDLTNAEGNRVTAILDYNRALASLRRAISSGQPR